MDEKLKKNVLLRYMKSMRKTPAAVAPKPVEDESEKISEDTTETAEESQDKQLTERAVKELNNAAMREAGTLPPTKTTANKRFLETTISHCLSHNKREDKKVVETSKKFKDLSKNDEEAQEILSSSSSDEIAKERRRKKLKKSKDEKSEKR